jgi:plasmid stabilization system protein ParE
MNYSLVFHTHVQTDLSDAYHWYENRQEGLGERFLSETHPEFYGKATKSYRRIVLRHFPYIIAFEIVNDSIFIYAVFHTSRNPREILKRKKTI